MYRILYIQSTVAQIIKLLNMLIKHCKFKNRNDFLWQLNTGNITFKMIMEKNMNPLLLHPINLDKVMQKMTKEKKDRECSPGCPNLY